MSMRGTVFAALAAIVFLSAAAGSASAQEIAGKGRAVVIGINGYYGMGELKYSGNDAVAVKNMLEASGDFERLYLLTERDEFGKEQSNRFLPTQNNILRTLRQAADGVGSDDQLLFFFSGHGIEKDGENYIVPLDGDENIAISIGEVKKIIGASKAGSKLLLIDACRSGGGMKGVPGIRGSSVVESVAEIGMIVSCGSDQFSYEDDAAQRSIFTLALEEGLAGAADLDDDKVIVGGEVFDFLSRRMREFCEETDRLTVQTPQINDFGRSSMLMRIPDEMAELAMPPSKMLSEGRALFAAKDEDGWDKAFGMFETVAEHDKAKAAEIAEAEYYLGLGFMEGRGTGRDLMTALDYWESAALEGHPDAQYALGKLYMDGKEVDRDYSEAARWLKMAAEQENVSGMVAMGELLYTGRGMDRDYTAAARYFRRAAGRGNPAASRFLGIAYYEGNGFKRDAERAERYFAEAVEAGDVESNYWIGEMRFRAGESEEARTLFVKAAESGYANAQNRLGALFLEGADRDYEEAARWLEAAADQGHGEAQFVLARLYENGYGVRESLARAERLRESAVEYLREHAELGESRAQALLGCAYSDGEGVAQDYKAARECLDKAGRQDNALAQFALGNLYHAGRGVEQDYAAAIDLYRKSALNGVVDAQVLMGSMYYAGQGVDSSAGEAAKWYQMATDNGSSVARRILSAMHYSGDGVERNTRKALLMLETE